MVRRIHKHNMRVILDVVYNHMHDVNNNALEKTVPLLFLLEEMTRVNYLMVHGVGMVLNSTAKMCRKYILDIARDGRFFMV